ncbi:hypothetical protein BSL78_23681 [Apostichopus japonicus]|uniref:Uncharacterized protein n=1 Tax=Stichopus japonicus TaxID=307972 RepID=A0A2G8JUN7_STIJA|nr:hypothetical protein BSL78_23681 [Apostichopus japonicus]
MPTPTFEIFQEAIIDMQSIDSFSMIELGPEINGPIKEAADEAEVSSEEPSSIESSDTALLVPYAVFAHLGGKSVDPPPKMEMPNTDYTSSKSQTKATESSTTVSKNEDTLERNNNDADHDDDDDDDTTKDTGESLVDTSKEGVGAAATLSDDQQDDDVEDTSETAQLIVADSKDDSEGVINEAFDSSRPSSPTPTSLLLLPSSSSPPSSPLLPLLPSFPTATTFTTTDTGQR